jgi:hypothetical protein
MLGIFTEAIFETVADVEFFTNATDPLPALRREAQELRGKTAEMARQVIARR